jgi:hypothetical protein
MNVRGWNLDIDRYLNRILPPSPLQRLPTPVSRFLGYRKEQRQDLGNVLGAFWSFVGAFCGLAVVAAVFNNTQSIHAHHPPVLIASFVRVTQGGLMEETAAHSDRVHLRSSNTTQSDHHSVSRATRSSATPSPH